VLRRWQSKRFVSSVCEYIISLGLRESASLVLLVYSIILNIFYQKVVIATAPANILQGKSLFPALSSNNFHFSPLSTHAHPHLSIYILATTKQHLFCTLLFTLHITSKGFSMCLHSSCLKCSKAAIILHTLLSQYLIIVHLLHVSFFLLYFRSCYRNHLLL
jgi:hypothetical protein